MTKLGLDQLFIDDEVPIRDDQVPVGDDVEWVELVEIPEEVPEKPKVQRKKGHQKILNLLRYFFVAF